MEVKVLFVFLVLLKSVFCLQNLSFPRTAQRHSMPRERFFKSLRKVRKIKVHPNIYGTHVKKTRNSNVLTGKYKIKYIISGVYQ